MPIMLVRFVVLLSVHGFCDAVASVHSVKYAMPIEPMGIVNVETHEEASLHEDPFLTRQEFEQHLGTLVEQIPANNESRNNRLFLKDMPRWSSGANVSFDVCEARSTCSRSACRGNGTGLALGAIRRARATALPTIAGNAPGSYCAVSRRHKFIFVHTLKNAGTFTKSWLREALCQEGHACDRETLILRSCKSAMQEYPKFFRWTFARHPFDRALSIYAMAKNYGLPADATFEGFWLQNSWWMKKTRLSPDHLRPQKQFMTDSTGCLAMDFIAWLPNAESEMARVVDLIGAEPLRVHLKTHGFRQPTKGNVFGLSESRRLHATGFELVNRSPRLQSRLSSIFIEDLNLFVGV